MYSRFHKNLTSRDPSKKKGPIGLAILALDRDSKRKLCGVVYAKGLILSYEDTAIESVSELTLTSWATTMKSLQKV